MTTSVSQRLNILSIMFKIIAFFMITLFARIYVRVGILLTCGKHLPMHDRIISLTGEACAHKTSLAPPLFIEVSVPIQENERFMHLCQGYRFCLFLLF